MLNLLELNFIELPKFNEELHELKTLTEKPIHLIKNAENIEVVSDNINDEDFKSAYKEASVQS